MLPLHNVTFITMTAQFTLQECLQHILNIYIQYCSQLHYPVYCMCFLHMLPFHNVIFFHNYCTIYSTTMFTAYPQPIHTILFTITLSSIITVLFTLLSLSQCEYFPQLLYNCLFHYVFSEASLDTYSTVYNYSPQYTICAVYICCPFHNVIFFHNYCTIDSTTMSTAYTQHIHTVLFTIRLPSILTLLFIYASFTQCDIFSQLLHNWLYNNVYSISATYTYSTVCNYSPQYTGFAVYICFPFHNVIFFHNDCTIYSTTMFTAYPQHIHAVLFTITLPSMLAFLFTYAFLFTMWIFFHSYCIIVYSTMFSVRLHWILTVLFTITLPSILSVLFTYADLFTMWYFSTITAQLTVQQCLQHILNIYIRYCLQLQYPVYCLYCLYMLSFSQCDIFPQLLHNWLYNNVYSISSTYTYGIVTITLPSILTLLFIYASFTQCDIFSQWLHNSLYNNVYSISSTYTYSTVHNYTTQLTVIAITYAILFTMWYFSTMTAQFTLQQCL